MEQSIWTYRDPAPTKTLDTNGIMSLIADYLKGPAERPLMIWCHNIPSINRLQRYLNDYKREDGAKLFELGEPIIQESSYKLVLEDGEVKDGSVSDYPDIAFLPYDLGGRFFGFFYYRIIEENQFDEEFSRALGLSRYYRMPAIFLVNDYAAFKVQDQIPRQFFDHVRYLPTVKEFIDSAKNTLETKNLSELGQYVYTNVINIAEGFVGDDDYAHYFKKLINAVVEIIKATEGCEGLKETYKDGPMAVTRIMFVGMGGFGSRLTEDNPELLFVKKFHAALQASKLAWMFDSNMPIPAEIAEFVGKEDE